MGRWAICVVRKHDCLPGVYMDEGEIGGALTMAAARKHCLRVVTGVQLLRYVFLVESGS